MLKVDLECDLEIVFLFVILIVYDILIVSADEIIDLDLNGVREQILEKISV